MKIFQKSLATLLIICMIFSLMPISLLPEVSADMLGTDTNNRTIVGAPSSEGGYINKGTMIYRVILSRDKNLLLNGTEERRTNVINYMSNKYPKSQNIESDTLFLWDQKIYNSAKTRGLSVGVATYTPASLNYTANYSPNYTSLNIGITSYSAATNTFKKKAMDAYDAKTIKDISDLANKGWEKYLPSLSDAQKAIGYIFGNSGGYDVDTKMCKFVDTNFRTTNIAQLNDREKFSVSAGYGGLLACLYVVSKQDSNRTAVTSSYAQALDDYFASTNLIDKPVTLIIDTGIGIVIDSSTPTQSFVIPTIDYIEYSMLTETHFSLTEATNSGFIATKYRDRQYNTREMVKAMAIESYTARPYSTTYATKGSSGIIRFVDMGGKMEKVRGTAMGRIVQVPQFTDGAYRIQYGDKIYFNTYDPVGYLGSITFSNSIKGFLVAGINLSNPVPDLTYIVESTINHSTELCDPEVTSTSPAKITLKFNGNSSLISSLSSRKDDPNFAGILIEPHVYRTEYKNGMDAGNIVEAKTEKADLNAQIQTKLNDDMMLYLQGQPMQIVDAEVMGRTYMKEEGAAQSIIWKYEIDLKITIDKAVYEYKADEIVSRTSNGVLQNYAELQIPALTNRIVKPADIEIPKPSSTTTTEVVQPSENENLSEMTQVLKRYEFTSGGVEFAEVKSNEPLKEEYEVMGGIPSSEELYFSVGGTEFRVAMIMQYWMNEHSRDRTYTIHFDSNICEYNNQQKGKGDSWEGINLPSAAGASQTTTRLEHATGTSVNYDGNTNPNKYGAVSVTATWTGQITNDASAVTVNGMGTATAVCPAQVNNSAYVTAVSQANAWIAAMNALTPQMKWTSASDKVERSVSLTLGDMGSGGATTSQGASGSSSGSFSDRGLMEGNWSYSFSNPADTQKTESKYHTESCGKDCTKTVADPVAPTANPDGPKPYTITVTYTIDPHALCGPCCEHVLPDLYDTWKQGLVYDFVKISQIRLYTLDQGSAEGFQELTGVNQIFANVISGNPTYFMNIAQQTELDRPLLPVNVPKGGILGASNDSGLTYASGSTTMEKRRASESSRDGRLRYILADGQTSDTVSFSEQGQGSGGSFTIEYSKVAAPEQHDDVIYDIGKRSMNCDGMGTTDRFGKKSSENAVPMEVSGHLNDWADGCLYTNIQNYTGYNSYHESSSYGYSYVPKELKDNDAAALGTGSVQYYEDYNHHVQRDNLIDKQYYSDKADQKDIQTPEWKIFDKARRTKIIANVISDFLILQTSGGDQSIFYYEKASEPTEAQEHFQKVKIPEDEILTNNPLTPFNDQFDCTGKLFKYDFAEDYIVVGGYNGRYDEPTKKYMPYSFLKKEFLPFAGTSGTYDANKHSGKYQYWGGTQVKTILDEDPAKTISRPERQATSQDTSFKILQDKIRILPTTANQLYEPYNSKIWYSQVEGFYSSNAGVIDMSNNGLRFVGCLGNVQIGWNQRAEYGEAYKKNWGNLLGVEYETKYFRNGQDDDNIGSINGVVVYTPVSTEDAMVLPQGDLNIEGKTISRDQRVNAFDFPDMNELVNKLKVCPLDPALCEYRYLDCKYHEPTVLSEFDFSETYTAEERNMVDGELVLQNVTKKNTYQENGKWITTDKITGIEYTLPSGFSIESGGQVGDGRYLKATGVRWSIPFSKIGLSNAKSNRIEVDMDVTVNSTESNLMLVSFQNYGLIIKPNKTLGSFVTRSILDTSRIGGRTDVSSGTLSKAKVSLIFSFNNVSDCTATVNGVPATVIAVSELRNVWVTDGGIRKLQLQQVTLNDLTKDAPDVLARNDIGNNLNIGSWGSGDGYKANYYIDNLKITLLGGSDTHNSSCYEKVTVHATKMIHVHDENCYAKGDIWTCDGEPNSNYQLGCNNLPLNAHTHDSSCFQSYNSGLSTGTTYTVAAGTTISWGSSGHTSANHDWPVVTINGSRYGTSYSGSYTFTSQGTVSWYIQTPCRGGAWCNMSGSLYQCSGVLNTHVHSGTAGLDYANGCYTNPTEHIHNHDKKVLTCAIPEGGTGEVKTYNYTGSMQSVTLSPGVYKLEAYGGQGGGSGTGGAGGYSTGTLTLTSKTVLYIGVGGKGASFNGGGSGNHGYGGGASHIALVNGELSTLSGNISSILLVAGGGGAASASTGGAGGGANMSGGGGGSGCGTPGAGASTSAAGSTYYAGSFGQGGNGGKNSCGGGGGFYGGGGSYESYHRDDNDDAGGGGGSGYANTSKLTNISGTTGANSGNGYVRITNLDHRHTNSCYTTTTITCSKIPAGTLVCTGTPNTLSDLNAHVHTVDCLKNYTNLPAKTFQYTGDVQTYVVPWTDYYKLETYGPSVGNKAGYAKGEVKLTAGTKLYIYVGSQAGYNGYMSDVRLVSIPNGLVPNGEEGINNENISVSNNSRILGSGRTLSSVMFGNYSVYVPQNTQALLKGNDGNGRVIITPMNKLPNAQGERSILDKIIAGDIPENEVKKYLGDELANTIINTAQVFKTYQNFSYTNPQGIYASTPNTQGIAFVNNNLICEAVASGGDEFYIPVSINAHTLRRIRVTLDNNSGATAFGVWANGSNCNHSSYLSVPMTANTNNQVIDIDVSDKWWNYNITSLNFDPVPGTTYNGKAIIKKIELIGHANVTVDNNSSYAYSVLSTLNNFSSSDTKGFVNVNHTSISYSGNKMLVTSTGTDPITRWNTIGTIQTGAVRFIKVVFTNKSGTQTHGQLFYSGDMGAEDETNSFTWDVGATSNTQTVWIDTVNHTSYNATTGVFHHKGSGWSGNVTGMRFDWSALSSGVTEVSEISFIGRGSASGTGQYSAPFIEYENVEVVWTFGGGGNTYNANTGISSITLQPGTYKLEAWGASGGVDGSQGVGGKGGYATGLYTVNTPTTVYVVVGGEGASSVTATGGGYNGGGNAGSAGSSGAGGGATHIAINQGTLLSSTTASNLLLVAGGGGGGGNSYPSSTDCSGAAGGGLTGISSSSASGGTQTSGGAGTSSGSYGQGGHRSGGNNDGGGGGGGYYGGGASNGDGGGAGGSSYVGSLSSSSTIAGNASMPSPSGGYEIGHSGNGYVKISKITKGNTQVNDNGIGPSYNFYYTGSSQSIDLPAGKYILEAWGASGGGDASMIGEGGYTKGIVTLTSAKTLYVYVGQQGVWYSNTETSANIPSATFNGGGDGGVNMSSKGWHLGGSGGGATDFRLVGGAWNNTLGLQSRILVAGGGGGSGCASSHNPGHGGGLIGATTINTGWYYNSSATGGSQTSGGYGNGTVTCDGSTWTPERRYGGFGYGASAAQCAAGGGGGYYGGGSQYTAGGAGGSSYVTGYTGCDTTYRSSQGGLNFTDVVLQQGGNRGNGYAKISPIYTITKSLVNITATAYNPSTFTAFYRNPLQNETARQTIYDNFDKIPDYVNGDYNPIWLCKFAEYNTHVCETKDGVKLCHTYTILNCNEPHHRGEHYSSSNRICWSACGNDNNHKNTKTETKDHNTNEDLQLAEFLQLDAGFTVYFPNIGNFEGNNKLGLANPQTTRGYGYHQNMDTTNWTREKRVKFPFDVIFEGRIHAANTWIDLDVPTEYFNFYLLVSNSEMANAAVEFEVEAINCNTGVGVNVNPSVSYSSTVSESYAKVLDSFLKNYMNVLYREVGKGYQMPLAKAKGANNAPKLLSFGKTGYENFYISKEDVEEAKLRNSMESTNKKIEEEFEGNGANGHINPHTYSGKGINHTVKPMTSNDNYVRVDNKLRQDSLESLHGGYKRFYLDVIGRIGNFALVDTEDFRFSNFFKMPIVSAGDNVGLADPNNWLVEGLVLKVDDEIQNLYVGDTYDLRGNKASPDTRWLDTYGTETWMAGRLDDINDSTRDINNPNLVSQILTGDINNIDVLKEEQLRFGYDAYTSLVTFGSYDNGQVQVVPKYYALKISDKDLEDVPAKYNVPKGTYIPLDVYIDKDGLYSPVNIYNNAGNGIRNKGNYDLYDYIFNLDWTDERARRNYTIEEELRTKAVQEFFKIIVYDIPDDPDIEIDFENAPIAEVEKYKIPTGKNNLLGTSQYILMDDKHRTFIGDRNSYGNNVYHSQAGNTDFGTDKNKYDALDDIRFKRAVQRWHGKLGIPSSSVFVPHGVEVNTDTIKYVMNDEFAILCTAEVIAIGDVWSIYYSQPWFDALSINGEKFKTSEHYPGHRVTDANGNSVECPDCLPPIFAVYSSKNSSIEDVEIIDTH